MSIPGFTAGVSLYRSKGHYLTIGGSAPVEGRVLLALSSGSLEALAVQASVGPPQEGGTRDYSIVPMSVPGHKTNLTGQCDACKAECLTISVGCDAFALVACGPFLAIPFIGGALYAVCAAIGAATCAVTLAFCVGQCGNVGSACCPVPCGLWRFVLRQIGNLSRHGPGPMLLRWHLAMPRATGELL